jgi:predicted O-methyltransferase YrrM
MKFEDIHARVGHVPFIAKENARILYDLILRERPARILELGIAHGTATCYMAAALEELGGGLITAVDLLETAATFQPSAEEQLERTGLSEFARVVRMQTGYTWFLHDEIARRTRDGACEPEYDLCVIDGPKNWTIDGAAFFMADKLLRRGGWMIFDDYDWTYRWDCVEDNIDGITQRSLSREELETPHIREVFELLVRQHPDYGDFLRMERNDWALARKTGGGDKTYTLVYSETTPDLFAKALRKVLRRLRGLTRSLRRG